MLTRPPDRKSAWGIGGNRHTFLTSAVDASGWLASCSGRFVPLLIIREARWTLELVRTLRKAEGTPVQVLVLDSGAHPSDGRGGLLDCSPPPTLKSKFKRRKFFRHDIIRLT